MKYTIAASLLLLVPGMASAQSITLDPAEMEAAYQRVFGQGVVPKEEPAPADAAAQGVEQRWLQAMQAAGTDLMPVLLLSLLSELNPQAPMATHAELYAAALELHRKAAAGNSQACEELALSLETAFLPGELRLFVSPGCAAALRQRAQYLQKMPTNLLPPVE